MRLTKLMPRFVDIWKKRKNKLKLRQQNLSMFQNAQSAVHQTYARSVQPQRFWMLLFGDLPLASQRKHIIATTVIMNFEHK